MNTTTAPFRTQEANAEAVLRDALLDSRQRWRDLVAMAGDMAFETDADGRFVFLSPELVVGWPSAALIGQPAELLLARVDGAGGFNPFRSNASVRHRRAWLRRPDGASVCMAFAAAPLFNAEGEVAGARGVGQDMSEQDAHEAAIAASLRRVELLDHILWRMRQEVLAPRMMRAALESLMTALGAEGCAVIDMIGDGAQPAVLYQLGEGFVCARDRGDTAGRRRVGGLAGMRAGRAARAGLSEPLAAGRADRFRAVAAARRPAMGCRRADTGLIRDRYHPGHPGARRGSA